MIMPGFFDLFSPMPPVLTTPRLTLRPVSRRDADDLFEYAQDDQVSRHVLWTAYRSRSEAVDYIRAVRRQYRSGFPGVFAIEYRENRKMIGTIGFMWINREYRSAEVGYSLNRSYWNRGIMTEALDEVLRYGFEQLRLNRIEAQHETDNPASGRVMEKAGMVREGVLRQRLKNKGRFVDVVLCAVLSQDDRIRRKKQENSRKAANTFEV